MSLTKENWSFADIEEASAKRAGLLESSPNSRELADAVVKAVGRAFSAGNIRFGFEEAEDNSEDVRAVVQFHVGELLFDRFFNSRSSYRAQFLSGWQIGLQFNADLIGKLRGQLRLMIPAQIEAFRLTKDFEIRCVEQTTSERLICSLDPGLSKIWFCGKLMESDGTIRQLVPAVSGPKILLDSCKRWAALFPTDSEAWLETKGAFMGQDRLYQPKDPTTRAKKLGATGGV